MWNRCTFQRRIFKTFIYQLFYFPMYKAKIFIHLFFFFAYFSLLNFLLHIKCSNPSLSLNLIQSLLHNFRDDLHLLFTSSPSLSSFSLSLSSTIEWIVTPKITLIQFNSPTPTATSRASTSSHTGLSFSMSHLLSIIRKFSNLEAT